MKKTGKLIACCALIATLTTGLFAGCSTSAHVEPTPSRPSANVQFGAPSASVGGSIGLMSVAIAPEDYEEYGVSATALEAYTITATVFPEYAYDKSVTWSIAWKSSTSDFAEGKTVTDYVKLSSNTGMTITVELLAAFGEQIVITATSVVNPDAKASLTCNYKNEIDGWGFLYVDGGYQSGESIIYNANSQGPLFIPAVSGSYSETEFYVSYSVGTIYADTVIPYTREVVYDAPSDIWGLFDAERLLGVKAFFQSNDEVDVSNSLGLGVWFNTSEEDLQLYLPFIAMFDDTTQSSLKQAYDFLVGNTATNPGGVVMDKYYAYYDIVWEYLEDNDGYAGSILSTYSTEKIDIYYDVSYLRTVGVQSVSVDTSELLFNS